MRPGANGFSFRGKRLPASLRAGAIRALRNCRARRALPLLTLPWRPDREAPVSERPGKRRDRRAPPAAGGRAMMDDLLREYLPILVFLALAIGIGLVFILAAVVLAVRKPDPEKISAYECGFNAFDDARMKFDVRFYLVSILFIIFDLEVAFLFPWAVAFQDIGLFGFWSMMVFLAVLTIGFAYEWKKGALEWE
jgi:NADH-quinone oxidoreductase subunit A